MREAKLHRVTKESDVFVELNLDGSGVSQIDTGIGFFDHMLTLFAFHAGFDLCVKAKGDLEVCDHHCVEDVGIVLGQVMKEALGEKKRIARYGCAQIPMDEVLTNVTLDISNRSYLVYHCELKREQIGSFSCEMVEEFLRAFAFQAGITLHVNVYYGTNDHHKVESIFKALGRAMKQGVQITNQENSTKGML